ncbi:hypothetical protein EG68_00007 [Paragonimus skrjabini miyazakii]|uniref:LicD/FKTN/FKRP nucleotidyltransferase domain-containing protein n=1 Tax=Paragonimus skrjabini miyazakii TaxID=59628 RepID=A0A8S9Z7W0_9TREM|nr:hypothetical protein EG68_00007 [Paragonimus skrjabini miyazakii]
MLQAAHDPSYSPGKMREPQTHMMGRIKRLILICLLLVWGSAFMYYWIRRFNTSITYQFLLRDPTINPNTILDQFMDYAFHSKGKFRLAFQPTQTSNDLVWIPVLIRSAYKRLNWTYTDISKLVQLVRDDLHRHERFPVHAATINETLAACQNSLISLNQTYVSQPSENQLESCFSYVEQRLSHSGLPANVTSDNSSRASAEDYLVPLIYFHPVQSNESSEADLKNCSVVGLSRRQSLLRTLKHWIKFAEDNMIIWWITYGSLLGSVRNGTMIPYDTDMDIAISGPHEAKLRRLATDRQNITPGQFNLITRPGDHCVYSTGSRVDCTGKQVTSLTDSCAFCGPLARIFYEFGQYIDIYQVHLELRLNSANKPLSFGFYDEGTHEYTLTENLHNASSLFPLSSCRMMGLDVPCPNEPDKILEEVYGTDFIIPKYKCNLTNGEWT